MSTLKRVFKNKQEAAQTVVYVTSLFSIIRYLTKTANWITALGPWTFGPRQELFLKKIWKHFFFNISNRDIFLRLKLFLLFLTYETFFLLFYIDTELHANYLLSDTSRIWNELKFINDGNLRANKICHLSVYLLIWQVYWDVCSALTPDVKILKFFVNIIK